MKKYLIKISAVFAVTVILAGTLAACGTTDSATDNQVDSPEKQIEQTTETSE